MEKELAEIHQYGVIVNKRKEVLWVKSKDGKQKLMLPGGTLEKKEKLEDALKREIKEETNLGVTVVDITQAEIVPKEPIHLVLVYLCINPKGEVKLSNEHERYVWKKPNEINKQEVAHPRLIEAAKKALKKHK